MFVLIRLLVLFLLLFGQPAHAVELLSNVVSIRDGDTLTF
jgi:hypothetical protein